MIFRPSNMQRRLLCPASARMELGLPDQDNDDAREGRLLHDYFANSNYERSVLSPAQRELLEVADKIEKEAIETCVHFWGLKEPFREDREVTIKSNERLEGTPDRVRYYWDSHAIIVLDAKFGRNLVEGADANIQLRCYGVMAYDTGIKSKKFLHGEIQNVCVGILQPRASYGQRISLAYYNSDDIKSSREQIQSIIDAASDHLNAELNPSDVACRRCRAARPELCPAFAKAMQVPAVLTPEKALSKAARTAYLEQRVAEFSNEELSKTLLAIQLAGFAKDVVTDEARKRGETEYWKIAKESEVRDITDVRKALSLLSLAGLEKADLFDCVQGISLTKLTEKLNKLHPNWTVKESNEWINKKLASVIEKQTRKARVLRK